MTMSNGMFWGIIIFLVAILIAFITMFIVSQVKGSAIGQAPNTRCHTTKDCGTGLVCAFEYRTHLCKAVAGTSCKNNNDCKSGTCSDGICETATIEPTSPGVDPVPIEPQTPIPEEKKQSSIDMLLEDIMDENYSPDIDDFADTSMDEFIGRVIIPSPAAEDKKKALFRDGNNLMGLKGISVTDFAQYTPDQVYVLGKTDDDTQVQFIYHMGKRAVVPQTYNVTMDQIEYADKTIYGTSDGELYRLYRRGQPHSESYPSNAEWTKVDLSMTDRIIHISAPADGGDLWIQSKTRGVFISNNEVEEVLLGQKLYMGSDREDVKMQRSVGQDLVFMGPRGWVPNQDGDKIKVIDGAAIVLK